LFVVDGVFPNNQQLLQFAQAQSQRRYTQVPHEVLAVYYVWYGYGKPGGEGWKQADTNRHVTANTARYPSWARTNPRTSR